MTVKGISKPSFTEIARQIHKNNALCIVHSDSHFNSVWKALNTFRKKKPILWSLRIGKKKWVICRYNKEDQNPLKMEFDEYVDRYGRHKLRAEKLSNKKSYFLSTDEVEDAEKEARALAMCFRKHYPDQVKTHIVRITQTKRTDKNGYTVKLVKRKAKTSSVSES